MQCPSSDPNQWLCSSAEPSRGHILQGTQWGADLPDLNPPRKSFAHAKAPFAHTQATEMSHHSTPCGECPLAAFDQKSGQQLLEVVWASST